MENKPPITSGNKHLSLQEKQKIIDEWKNTGLSKHEFCKSRKIIATTFYGWLKQVARVAGMPDSDLAPVAVVKKSPGFMVKPASESEIEIFLPAQTVIRLRVPVETLITLIKGLSHASHTAR